LCQHSRCGVWWWYARRHYVAWCWWGDLRLDAEEEGPRSVSGSVGVVAKLLQSLPTAGVWAALDGTTEIHGDRAKVLALVTAGSPVALAASETTVTVEPCVVPASTSLDIESFSCETQKLLEASERLKNPVFVQWFVSSGTMHTLSGIHNNFPLTVPYLQPLLSQGVLLMPLRMKLSLE